MSLTIVFNHAGITRNRNRHRILHSLERDSLTPFGNTTVTVAIIALHLPFVTGDGLEAGEVGRFCGRIGVQCHPVFTAIEAEVINIEIVLIRAVEVVDGDVTFSRIAAQVGSVFHIRIGSGGLGNQSSGKIRNRSSSGGEEDFKMLTIVGAASWIATQPHPQGTLQVKLR